MLELPKTTELEDRIASEEGMRIFAELRKRYSNNSIRDLDIVLNSLCAALIRLAKLNTSKEDADFFGELIKNIIVKNLKQ
jgi:hypothetical protein